ncbi:MAG: DUF1361 domain-containing protein [Flavisolibacter sp.]
MNFLERNSVFRYYSRKSDASQVLIMSSLFSLALMGCRMIYSGEIMFVFLVWNLFLAYLPFALTEWMQDQMKNKSRLIFFAFVFIWLMFIPNTFYIITDLIHLEVNSSVPVWYDLVLLLSFAWNGVLFGIVSVRQMEKLFELYFNKRFGLFFIIPVMILNAFGVYVGRHLRFNSWDVVTDPFQLIQDVVVLFIHPIQNKVDWSIIVCYSLLLSLFYVTVKRMGRVLRES